MGRITPVWLAVATIVTGPASILAQMTPNQIVSGSYTLVGYSPNVLIVSPNEVLTLFTPPLDVPDAVATQTPLPSSLSGVSVLVRVVGALDTRGYPTALPILSIFENNVGGMPALVDCSASANANLIYCANTAITVQIPVEGVCALEPATPPGTQCPANPPFTDYPPLLLLNVSANGVTGPDLPVQFAGTTPHLLNSCETVFGPNNPNTPSNCNPVVIHGDGSFVTNRSPAKVGETITLYATGLGLNGAAPSGTSGYPTTVPVQYFPVWGVTAFTYVASTATQSGGVTVDNLQQLVVQPNWVGLAAGYVGLYQVNVTLPPMPGLPACSSTGNVSVLLPQGYANTITICIQP
jgi:uncharacterized protein (TIGR03437 family)